MLQKENKNHLLSLFHAKVYSELQVIYNIMYLFFTTAHLSSSFFKSCYFDIHKKPNCAWLLWNHYTAVWFYVLTEL